MKEKMNELDAPRRLLREIADLCEHGNITGALQEGVGRVVRRYNALLSQFEREGRVPPGAFEPLPDSANFAEIAVEARMLAAYLKPQASEAPKTDPSILLRLAPFVRGEDLTKLVRKVSEARGALDMNLVTSLAPFLDQAMLSDLLQQHVVPPAPEAPRPPEAPLPPEPPTDDLDEPIERMPVPFATEVVPAEPSVDEVTFILERLRDPHLSPQQRDLYVDRLQQLTGR